MTKGCILPGLEINIQGPVSQNSETTEVEVEADAAFTVI